MTDSCLNEWLVQLTQLCPPGMNKPTKHSDECALDVILAGTPRGRLKGQILLHRSVKGWVLPPSVEAEVHGVGTHTRFLCPVSTDQLAPSNFSVDKSTELMLQCSR